MYLIDDWLTMYFEQNKIGCRVKVSFYFTQELTGNSMEQKLNSLHCFNRGPYLYSVKAKIKSTVTLGEKKKRRKICLPDTQGESRGKKCR